jgi:hypothetical protein
MTGSHGYGEGDELGGLERIVDMALFYERNNLLLNPDYGFVPANVYATIVEGLEDIAAASQDMWKKGVVGERLTFDRLDRET